MYETEFKDLEKLGFEPVFYTGGKIYCNCHLHAENKPSLVVYVSDMSYHCFGCHAKGNIEGYEECVRWMEWWHDGGSGFDYDGLPDEAVRLSEAPDEYKQYILSRGYSVEYAISKGVCACADGRYGGRIIIPLSCGGFAARWALGDRIYSMMDPSFRKILYNDGFNLSRNLYELGSVRPESRVVILVEGVFDAWRCEQQIGGYIACTFSSRLHKRQLDMLMNNNIDEICFGYDNDSAGLEAIEKSLRMISPRIATSRLNLQVGKDPDDSRKGLKKAYKSRYALDTNKHSIWAFA